MARQTYYVTRDMKNPLRYPTRMLTAGQEVTLSQSAADLFRKVGVELSDEAPKRAAPKAEPVQEIHRPVDGQGSFSDERVDAPKSATKAAPKKAARRKKQA